jgi:hypothetical protein
MKAGGAVAAAMVAAAWAAAMVAAAWMKSRDAVRLQRLQSSVFSSFFVDEMPKCVTRMWSQKCSS